ncbi:Rad21/Rec8-like protein, C-terminal, eukaryotic [Dillenia turbinata]|uniref:Rad21/Rec8-like protein, C-terminal, eukaryotic n=1 Tax=Dillenia turbinata TaxID=194707 RepID=A0AAN8YUN5_9MAGN
MFYSQFILAKKGPLGTIWIAAHLERKLRKNQVADTDIGVSVVLHGVYFYDSSSNTAKQKVAIRCLRFLVRTFFHISGFPVPPLHHTKDSILFPEVPIALRLSSHLLLGVVRIYSRKVNYLFDDCSEALLKIKQAFRSTAVDLPPEESTAPYHSITLPETFDLDDFELPDSDIFQGNYVDHHISTREQITLQDTMEGVVYSTSQFGLDERFGDGDTSQIGLDLDEDLFLDKVVAPGFGGDASILGGDPKIVQPTLLREDDAEPTEISSARPDTNTTAQLQAIAPKIDYAEYAQAPTTPGLVEQPNLSVIQDTLACDDHLEPEDHNLTEFMSKDDDIGACDQLSHRFEDQTAGNCGLVNDVNHDTVLRDPAVENGYISDGQIIREATQQGDSLALLETADNISPDNALPVSLPTLELTKIIEPRSSAYAGAIHSAIDPQEQVKNGENETVKSIDPRLDISSTMQNPEFVLETSCKNIGDVLEINQISSEPEQCNNVEVAKESSIHGNSLASSAGCLLLSRTELELSQERENSRTSNPATPQGMLSGHWHVLKSCNSSLSRPGSSGKPGTLSSLTSEIIELSTSMTSGNDAFNSLRNSIEVQGLFCNFNDCLYMMYNSLWNFLYLIELLCSYVSDAECHERYSPKAGSEATDSTLSEDTRAEQIKLEDVGHADLMDIPLEESNSACLDLPAPERLLSVRNTIPDASNDLLMVSIPDKGNLAEGEAGVAGVENFSGRKRSYTEITETANSIHSVESLALSRSKQSSEFIPDDDDLLSSILVGRTSVLKMKPTPSIPEEAPAKRPRSIARVVAKRKVLMDDTVILHGDTIRRQLTSTEDIRRIRKKAPCSRPEIWIMQKRLLEDEIFTEPLHAGISAELILLHSQAYDLSGIKVCQDDEESYEETAKRMESLQRFADETAIQGVPELSEVQTDRYVQPAKEGDLPSDFHGGGDATALQMKASSDKLQHNTLEHEPLGERGEMEIDGRSTLAGEENCAVIPGVEPSSLATPASEGNCSTAAGDVVQSAPLEESKLAGATLEKNVLFSSPDQEVGGHSIEKGFGIIDDKVDGTGCIIATESGKKARVCLDKSEDGRLVESMADIDVGFFGPTKSVGPSQITMCLGNGGHNNIVVECANQATENTSKSELGPVDGDEFVNMELAYGDKNKTFDVVCHEESKIDSFDPVKLDVDVKIASFNEGEDAGCQELNLQDIGDTSAAQNVVDADFTAPHQCAVRDQIGCIQNKPVSLDLVSHRFPGCHGNTSMPVQSRDNFKIFLLAVGFKVFSLVTCAKHFFAVLQDLQNTFVGHDTGIHLSFAISEFLNVDDDEIPEEDGFVLSTEETRINENSGWSSRTRAVAKYLQSLFDKEAEHGRKVFPMDNLLPGKTRKEASRMFFETLVLKTRDYINVEQINPFDNIDIKPRVKLMKSDF